MKALKKEDNERLRSISRHYLSVADGQAKATAWFQDEKSCAKFFEHLQLIRDYVDCMEREQLLLIAEKARLEGIAPPRRKKALSDEQGAFFLAVRARVGAGISERQACRNEADARGATDPTEWDAYWNDYMRIKSRIEEIVVPLGLDIEII